MRIDNTHRWWFVAFVALSAAAVALHAWLGWGVPGGLTGGTRVGLWFGIAGSLVMLFVGSLSGHRWLASIRWLPRSWIGRRQDWLRAHIWLGLLSVVLVLVHSNYRVGGPLTLALWVVLAITTVSGIVGAVLQHVLPRVMTVRVEHEAPFEQLPHLCRRMREDADEALDNALDKVAQRVQAAEQLAELHRQVCAFLKEEFDQKSPLANKDTAARLFAEVRGMPGMDEAAEPINGLEALWKTRHHLEELRLAPEHLEALHKQVAGFLEKFDAASQLADQKKADAFFKAAREKPGMEGAKAAIDQMEALCQERRKAGANAESEKLLGRLIKGQPTRPLAYLYQRMCGQAELAFEQASQARSLGDRARKKLEGMQPVVLSFLGEEYDSASPLADEARSVRVFEQVRGVKGMGPAAEALGLVEALCADRRRLHAAGAAQAAYFYKRMRDEADEALALAPRAQTLSERGRQELHALHQGVREFLGEAYSPSSEFAEPIRSELIFARARAAAGVEPALEAIARMELLCRERRDLGEQAILHGYLHYWLLAHVPITLALLVLGVAHAVLAVYW